MNAFAGIPTLKPHLALNVNDVERSTAFYRAMFGIDPMKTRAGYAKFDVDNPPLNLTLNQQPLPADTGLSAISHMGIQVAGTEQVTAIRERWQSAGLLPRDEMNAVCCYARQDKAWVRDPDGNEWEAFAVLEDQVDQPARERSCCPS